MTVPARVESPVPGAAPDLPEDAVAFVRFCRERRRVAWPEMYDEMCAVARRRLFRGWGFEELAEHGVEFGLFQLAALAAATRAIIADESCAQRAAVESARADAARAESARAESARADADAEAGAAATAA